MKIALSIAQEKKNGNSKNNSHNISIKAELLFSLGKMLNFSSESGRNS